MAKKEESAELAVVSTAADLAAIDSELAKFTIFSVDPDELEELRADMAVGGTDKMSRFDLPQIKMPSGGALQFIMPDGSSQATIRGIILAHKDVRTYYASDETMGTPPDCSSEDCIMGFGRITPDQKDPALFTCDKCPRGQWGSSLRGGGKACSERRLLAIQLENGFLPVLFNLPVTSVRPLVAWMRAVISEGGATMNNYIVELGLEQKVNANGIKYAVVKPMGKPHKIDPRGKQYMKEMRMAAKAMLESTPAEKMKSTEKEDTSSFDTEAAASAMEAAASAMEG